ncbi:MAG: hypothetical protein ACRDH5_07640 [bacterium]
MEGQGALVMGLVLVVLPLLVLMVDALFLGFDLALALAALLVFAVGLMFVAAVVPQR